MKGSHQKKARVYKFVVFFLLFSFLILGACNQTSIVEKENDTKVDRKNLLVSIDRITYDKEKKEVTAELSTNIPDGTNVDFTLVNSKDEKVTYDFNVQVQDGMVTPVFTIEQEYELDRLIDGEYQVISKIEVIGDNNLDFEYDSNFGGEFSELVEQYKDSEFVTVEDGDKLFDYTVTIISSNKFVINNLYTAEEKAQLDAEQEKEYKQRYISQMKDHASQMSEQFDTFSMLLGNPKFDSVEWKVDLSVVITEITRLSKEPENFYVPQEYKESHAIYLEAMKEYEITMKKLPSSLDAMDAKGFEEVKDQMDQALAKVKKVHEMLDNQ